MYGKAIEVFVNISAVCRVHIEINAVIYIQQKKKGRMYMSKRYVMPIDRGRALLDFARPADYAAVCEYIEIMAERYSFLSVTSIGETLLGKKIHMLTLGDAGAEKSVLYVGAHHGMEWITTLILLRFVNEYCEYYKAAKQVFGVNIRSMFAEREICVVPQLNADGADIQINGAGRDNPMFDRLMKMSGGDFSRWQANARGVDLNHNYDAGFEEYKKLEKKEGILPGATRWSGEYPESEPETGALANYIRFNEKISMIITLHSQGEEIYYTSGGHVPEGAGQLAAKLAKLSGYTVSVPEGLAAYGGLTDWYIKEFDRPSFTVECGKGENPIRESKYFPIYAAIREMLFCAPMMI